jgi:hypothetical protein
MRRYNGLDISFFEFLYFEKDFIKETSSDIAGEN